MDNFRLENIFPAEEAQLHKGIYIILLHALRIPPHLLVSVNGSVFSLSVKGQHCDEPIEKYFELIQRKKIPTLFVEWKIPENSSAQEFENELRKNVLKYGCVNETTSCLFPIRDTAAKFFGNEMQEAAFIFELLPLLKNKNTLGKTFHCFMNENILPGEKFELLHYTIDQLNDAILAAKH